MPSYRLTVESGNVSSIDALLTEITNALSSKILGKIRGSLREGLTWDEQQGSLKGEISVDLEQADIQAMEDDPLTEETFLVNTTEEIEAEFRSAVNEIAATLKAALE